MGATAGATSVAGNLKDASEFARRAIEQGVAFVPGAQFYAADADADADAATLRLSFAMADVGMILERRGGLVGRRTEASLKMGRRREHATIRLKHLGL